MTKCCAKTAEKDLFHLFQKMYYDLSKLGDRSIMDGHTHLDRLFRRDRSQYSVNMSHLTMEELILGPDDSRDLRRTFAGCIANFIQPDDWTSSPFSDVVQRCASHRWVTPTLGCHPQYADKWTQETPDLLKRAVQDLGNVAAIGECGLDSVHSTSWNDQERAFKGQISVARAMGLPLVIHLRKAEVAGREILRQAALPSDWPIHRHCFVGSSQEYEEWKSIFPNTYFSFTGWVTYPANVNMAMRRLVEQIPADRLIVESDAPYFLPRQARTTSHYSRPAHTLYVAQALASMRGVSVNNLLNTNKTNILKLYKPRQ